MVNTHWVSRYHFKTTHLCVRFPLPCLHMFIPLSAYAPYPTWCGATGRTLGEDAFLHRLESSVLSYVSGPLATLCPLPGMPLLSSWAAHPAHPYLSFPVPLLGRFS